jgi:hypothetical protein
MRKTFVSLVALATAAGLACKDEPKEVDLKFDKDKIEIKSKTKTETCEDYIQFELEAKSDGAEIRLKVDSKIKLDEEPDVKGKFGFRQKVFRVIEFVDANNDNKVTEDEVLQVLKIGDRDGSGEWGDFQKSEADGVYTFSNTAGWFKLVARYSGDPADFKVNDTSYTLNPSSVKADYIITGFPYQGNNSKLAIDGRFKSKAKFRPRTEKPKASPDGDDEEEFEVSDSEDGAGVGAKFMWVKVVKADGQEVPVVASPKAKCSDDDENEEIELGESNYKIVWVFLLP